MSSSNSAAASHDCEDCTAATTAAIEANKDEMGGHKAESSPEKAKKDKKKGRACKHFKEFGPDEEYKKCFCTNPHFVCSKCGRCAQRSDQLCRPEPIDEPKK